jgi:hypothetical protein
MIKIFFDKKITKNTKNSKRRSLGIISIFLRYFLLLETNYHLHMLSIVIHGLVFKYIQ